MATSNPAPDALKVRQVFIEVSDLIGPEREEALVRLSGGDLALAAEVRALLAADGAAQGFLAAPTALSASAPDFPGQHTSEAITPPARIGPYRILGLIGEGGFGSVYLAQQEQPVTRQVAIKIIKLGMDTRQVVARFEQERQVLALMDHPNIARVLEAGATDAGRPYFVMDLVKGAPIVDYCDQHNLNIDARLDLAIQVCSAVQHAHTKGIIHRDIKPSNILVSTIDGRPSIKVIDFGIAKATRAKLTEKTLFTDQLGLIGTPEYMSPEQAQGSIDIDTRTDIYALGVLLYELLTGSTPFTRAQLRSAAFGELQRIIRDVEPPNPSTRLSQSTDSIDAIAACRQTQPRKLGTLIRGELDWIVMKALEKDRNRRYETASSLAGDLESYRRGGAIIAAPASHLYQLRTFVRRHRTTVSAAAAITVSLMAGLSAFAWQARVARTQRDLAVQALAAQEALRITADQQRDRALTAEATAAQQAADLKQISDFQAGMLDQIKPARAGERLSQDVAARFEAALARTGLAQDQINAEKERFAAQWARINPTDVASTFIDETILKPAISTLDSQLKDQPSLDAQLRQTLAERYRTLGLYDAALPLQARALEMRRRDLGNDHPLTLESIIKMGRQFEAQSKHAQAEPLLREAVTTGRRVLGDDHPTTLDAIDQLGQLLQLQGDLAGAQPLLQEALERRRRVLGENHLSTLNSISNYGGLLWDLGTPAKAEPYYREALERTRALEGADHPETLISLGNLGALLMELERPSEAEPLIRSLLEGRRRTLGEDHPKTVFALDSLGNALRAQGRLDEALVVQEEALRKMRLVMANDPFAIAMTVHNMATLKSLQKEPLQAESFAREAVELCRGAVGPEHIATLNFSVSLCRALREQNKLEEARQLGTQVASTTRRLRGDRDQFTLIALVELARTLNQLGKFEDTVALLSPCEPTLHQTYEASTQFQIAYPLLALGKARSATARTPEQLALARSNLKEAHTLLLAQFGDRKPETIDALNALEALDAKTVP